MVSPALAEQEYRPIERHSLHSKCCWVRGKNLHITARGRGHGDGQRVPPRQESAVLSCLHIHLRCRPQQL